MERLLVKLCLLCAFHCFQIVHNIFIIHLFVFWMWVWEWVSARIRAWVSKRVHFGAITSQLLNNFALKNITNVCKFRCFWKSSTGMCVVSSFVFRAQLIARHKTLFDLNKNKNKNTTGRHENADASLLCRMFRSMANLHKAR